MNIESKSLGLNYQYDPVNKKVIILGSGVFTNIAIKKVENKTRELILWSSISDGNVVFGDDNTEVFFPDANTTGHSSSDVLEIIFDMSFEEVNVSSIKKMYGRRCITVVPSDTVDCPVGFVMVLGNAGNVAVITDGGDEDIWPLDRKEWFPILVKRIKLTGTTATNIRIIK